MAVATSEPTPVPTPAVSQQLPCQQLCRPPECGGPPWTSPGFTATGPDDASDPDLEMVDAVPAPP
eukprot:7604169-Lingulodinium_polyedra.AAC.1